MTNISELFNKLVLIVRTDRSDRNDRPIDAMGICSLPSVFVDTYMFLLALVLYFVFGVYLLLSGPRVQKSE